jgi:hypothetical protein
VLILAYLEEIDGDCILGLRSIESERDDARVLGDWF